MRIFRLIAASITLAAITALSAFAQAPARSTPARPAATPAATSAAVNVPDTKIAYVNTEYFGDEKAGITRFVNAIKSLEREFQPRQTELNNMQSRLKTLADDIQKLSGANVVDPNTIRTKQDEAEQLQRDIKRKKEDADAAFQKRYETVVSPISQDIVKSLGEFATSRGITMMFDISKLAPAVLTANPAMDLTQAFIAEYNRTHPATASAQ
ncbi:MAG TPA: OmpH family outer membrane protein [Pyrinomonadaceae bacterium]|jgi:Skp family chaperone for outer membrane proteins